MIKYSMEHVDYYEHNPVRAFHFLVTDGKQTAILGSREDVALRDEKNQTNIIGALERKQEEAVKYFCNTNNKQEFEEKLQLFLKNSEFYKNRTEIEAPLAEYIKDYNNHNDQSLRDMEYRNACMQLFNSMDWSSEFSAIGKALGKKPNNRSFWERIKNRLNEPAEPQTLKLYQEYYLPKFSKTQKENLSNLFDAIEAVPEKSRKNVRTSFIAAEDLWRILNQKDDAKQIKNYMQEHPNIQVDSSLLKETLQKIADNKKQTSKNYDVLWAENKTEEEKSTARLNIDKKGKELEELSSVFITKAVIANNRDIDENVLKNLIATRVLLEIDADEKILKDRRDYADRRVQGVQYEDLKKVFLTEAVEDRLRFEQYKKTGNITYLASDSEVKTASQMDKVALLKTYGPTLMSSYKSAAFVMETLKKEGKQNAKFITAITKIMDNKYQSEKEFNPDGIKQFMFDTFMDMSGKSLDKFSADREVYADFAKCLKGHNKKRSITIDKFVFNLMTDTLNVSKKKKTIKSRLAKRAEALKAGKNVISGMQIITETEKEIQLRAEEGYEVKDRNKVLQRKKKELNKKQLTPQQKKLVERFTEKSK